MTPDDATSAGAYAGRDVINAPDVKRAIVRRSQTRGDPPEIASWLVNHFFRHAIGNFQAEAPTLVKLVSVEQAQRLYQPSAPPEWLTARLRRPAAHPTATSVSGAVTGQAQTKTQTNTQTLWWLDPAGPALLALEERLLEFLHTRAGTALEGKLARINCPQALALWAMEHAAFEAKTTAGWRDHQPEAITVRMTTEHGMFVEFVADSPLLRAEMAYESQMMRHCLGQFAQRRALSGGYGERYASECEAGRMRLFSFRTGQQQPHITLNAIATADGHWRIDQIKGKQNRPPVAKYRDAVRDFLNSLDTDDSTPDDAIGIGLLRTRSGWQAAADIVDPLEQVRIVYRRPQLVRELPRPAPLVQWLVAARHPQHLAGLTLLPEVARALAGAGVA